MNPVILPVAWTHRQPAVRQDAASAAAASDIEGDIGADTWLLQRRNALSPRQFAACFAAVAVMSGLVGALFWLVGAGFVTGFAGLEVVVVGLAFGWHALHAADGERLRMQGSEMMLECRQGLRCWHERVSLAGLQLSAAADGSIEMRSGRRHWVLGRHATVAQRRRVLTEIRRALARTTE